MVGAAILKKLHKQGYENLFYYTHNELDLTNQKKVSNFFKKEKIDQIYLAAAKVGGIYANSKFPANFIYENLMIQSNIIHNAFINNVKKILFLGSTCIYPKNAKQPIIEEELLNGKLEPTNEPYAIAKIAGLNMCKSYNIQYGKSHGLDYRCIMPTNLFGEGDTYDSENSHVIPALIIRFHDAKKKNLPFVTVWGSGKPKREFLYVDDLADASVFVMNLDKKTYLNKIQNLSHINVGSEQECTIKELAFKIKEIVGYKGQIFFDKTKPDGPMRKKTDITRINNIGWKSKIDLLDGLKLTYRDFLKRL